MVLQKTKEEYVTLREFLTAFGLNAEFSKIFGMSIAEWENAPDLSSYDVMELLLEKHRSETDYILIQQHESDEVHLITL